MLSMTFFGYSVISHYLTFMTQLCLYLPGKLFYTIKKLGFKLKVFFKAQQLGFYSEVNTEVISFQNYDRL